MLSKTKVRLGLPSRTYVIVCSSVSWNTHSHRACLSGSSGKRLHDSYGAFLQVFPEINISRHRGYIGTDRNQQNAQFSRLL